VLVLNETYPCVVIVKHYYHRSNYALKNLQTTLKALSVEKVVICSLTPTQKKDIVECYKKLGHIVAMTGTGWKDYPAMH
jgi:magnesium-transporting ATPase (P-type)